MQSDGVWQEQSISAPDSLEYGYWPDISISHTGDLTIYSASSYNLESGGYYDLTLYRTARKIDGSWETKPADGPYVGGYPSAYASGPSGYSFSAYRYVMHSALFGHSGSTIFNLFHDDGRSWGKFYLNRDSWCVGRRQFIRAVEDRDGTIYVAYSYSNGCSDFEGVVVHSTDPGPAVTPDTNKYSAQ